MKFLNVVAFLSLVVSSTAFTTSTAFLKNQRQSNPMVWMSSTGEVDLGLTPELKKVTDAFASIPDEQLRYKQLLYMAQNTKEANNMPESSKTPDNKVPGCLSTVYVDGTAKYSEEEGDYVIDFIGDSDGLLTRGLVALLVRCLSGNTAQAIQKVDPQFIKTARIEQSLTPGRNNGFLNMLRSMKQKAINLDATAKAEGGDKPPVEAKVESEAAVATTDEASTDDGPAPASSAASGDGGPKYNAIVSTLQALKPTSVTLVDKSHEHSDGEEAHFELSIVADAFDGLNLAKRHQLIYMILGEIMPQIYTLQIQQASTPDEAG